MFGFGLECNKCNVDSADPLRPVCVIYDEELVKQSRAKPKRREPFWILVSSFSIIVESGFWNQDSAFWNSESGVWILDVMQSDPM